MSQRIDWTTAPPVPIEITERLGRGEPIGGEIVKGPLGQKTFVRHGATTPTARAPQQVPVGQVPGGAVHSELEERYPI